MEITFIQTADAFGYRKMLGYTAETVTAFCQRHGFRYESYIGIKRGVHPWQASFNRLFMLKDLVDGGYRGWVVYMDADAYIYDLDFDLKAYLADKADKAGIFTPIPGDEKYWSINNGVMLLNLAHPAAQSVIHLWHERYMAVSDDTLRELVEWPGDINDQTFLYEILDSNQALREAFFYESGKLLNDPYGAFIRQLLRAYFPIQSERAIAIRNAVSEVIGDEEDNLAARAYPAIISALYRVLLRRDPDAGGLAHFGERFRQQGIETAFRETFSEFLVSREYLEVRAATPDGADPAEQVRAAYRWILDRQPDASGFENYVRLLSDGHIDAAGLRRALLESAEFANKVASLEIPVQQAN